MFRSIPFSVRLLVVACALVGMMFGVSAALAAGRADDVSTLKTKLAKCRQDATLARQAVIDADDFLELARKNKIVEIKLGGSSFLVALEMAVDYVTLRYIAGDIDKRAYVRQLAQFARSGVAVVKSMTALRDDARDARDKTQNRCATLAKQLSDKPKEGEKEPPAETGAFPGGTAVTLTLTVGTATQERNMKTGVATAKPTIQAKNTETLSGEVSLDGTLPPGWEVVVFHPQVNTTLLRGNSGGKFSGIKVTAGFEAVTGVAAYICPKTSPWVVNAGCPPSSQANIDIKWNR